MPEPLCCVTTTPGIASRTSAGLDSGPVLHRVTTPIEADETAGSLMDRLAEIGAGALVEALKKGRPGMAAVDVFEEEPVLGANHPLLHMDNVVATPHLGYVERDGYETSFSSSFEQVLAFAAGKPINVINPEALQVKR